MSIQYAGGTIVNTTFTSDGTRQDLVTQLNNALKTAGWSVISGDGTADVLMVSATTPQGCFIRFRLYEPGSGNCAQITMKNNGSPSALTSGIAYLLPANTQQYRIIANKYQFFIFASGAALRATTRRWVAGGVLYIPSGPLRALGVDLQCGWLSASATSDTDAGNASFWRYTLNHTSTVQVYGSSLILGAVTNYNNYNQASVQLHFLSTQTSNIQAAQWMDNSWPQIEPLISHMVSGSRKIVGSLWDAFVMNGQVVGESTITFDGHTFMAITDQSSYIPYPTLWVAVD